MAHSRLDLYDDKVTGKDNFFNKTESRHKIYQNKIYGIYSFTIKYILIRLKQSFNKNLTTILRKNFS